MTRTHYAVIPSYVNGALLVASTIALWTQGQSISFITTLGPLAWLLLFFMSALVIII